MRRASRRMAYGCGLLAFLLQSAVPWVAPIR